MEKCGMIWASIPVLTTNSSHRLLNFKSNIRATTKMNAGKILAFLAHTLSSNKGYYL